LSQKLTTKLLRLARSLVSEDKEFEYPRAGSERAQPEVQEAVDRFRNLPRDERAKLPLLYWLLGAGTPAYKIAKEDCDYKKITDNPEHTCGNCEFYYYKPSKDIYICSHVEGEVEPEAWCNRWKYASGLDK
jgi:hypothetical protein